MVVMSYAGVDMSRLFWGLWRLGAAGRRVGGNAQGEENESHKPGNPGEGKQSGSKLNN